MKDDIEKWQRRAFITMIFFILPILVISLFLAVLGWILGCG